MKEKEWEKLLRIKTTGRDDTRSDTFRYPYEPTSYEVLERLANTGFIGKNNTLLDYGCGKGRVSIFMAYQTKCHSIGIEYDERIYNRALANKADTVSGNRVQFLCEDAVGFKIADNVDRFFFFNPFSIEIFKSVLANIIDSYYEAQREMLIMCYYPSDEYLMCLSQEYNATFVHEIDCSDVSDGEAEREKIVVYRVGEGE
jgi:predicted RNA methylase